MRRKRTVVTGIFLLSILFCCSGAMAETYNFGGATGNGEYSGTLAVDNSGNVAVAIAASTGELQVVEQVSGDTGGAFATQAVNATGNRIFIGTGASNANGDTASTGALASGNAAIDTVQGAIAGGNGVAAGQATYMEGQTAVAGSLGVSGDGYQASTDTHVSNGGMIDTMQGTAAGRILFLGINAAGAVAGQISEILAGDGGWASSTSSGHGNTASTQASVTGEGLIETIQVTGAGQVESRIEISGFFADLSVEGAFAGQYSNITSDTGGYTGSNTASANGYQANTGTRYSGTGNTSTIQGAAAGQFEGQLGYSESSADLSVGGAVAGQASRIGSTVSGAAQSSSSGNGFQAETSAGFEGDGRIDTIQGAVAGEIDIFSAASVAGAAAGQYSNITSNSVYGAVTAPESTVVESGRGYAHSSATTRTGTSAETSAEYSGSGYIDTIQGAAAGEIDIFSAASVAGAVAGQSSSLGSDDSGRALTLARYNNGYDQVELMSQFSGGGSIDDITQGTAAGTVLVTDFLGVEPFEARGAAGFQESSSSSIGSTARHSDTHSIVLGSTPPSLHWVVAGRYTDGGITDEGVDGGFVI